MFSLERYFDYFGPAEGIYFDAVLKDNESVAGNSQLDISAGRVFTRVETDPVHLQPLGVLQEVHLGLGRTLALVEFVELRHLPVQLLSGRHGPARTGTVSPEVPEGSEVAGPAGVRVPVAQGGLDRVAGEQADRGDRGHQAASQQVPLDLEVDVVPRVLLV